MKKKKKLQWALDSFPPSLEYPPEARLSSSCPPAFIRLSLLQPSSTPHRNLQRTQSGRALIHCWKMFFKNLVFSVTFNLVLFGLAFKTLYQHPRADSFSEISLHSPMCCGLHQHSVLPIPRTYFQSPDKHFTSMKISIKGILSSGSSPLCCCFCSYHFLYLGYNFFPTPSPTWKMPTDPSLSDIRKALLAPLKDFILLLKDALQAPRENYDVGIIVFLQQDWQIPRDPEHVSCMSASLHWGQCLVCTRCSVSADIRGNSMFQHT